MSTARIALRLAVATLTVLALAGLLLPVGVTAHLGGTPADTAVHGAPMTTPAAGGRVSLAGLPAWGQPVIRLDAAPGSAFSGALASAPAGSHWADVNGSTNGYLPGPRAYVASAYDPVDHEVVAFGGVDLLTNLQLSDTWVYKNGVWLNITSWSSTHPLGRLAAQMTFDPGSGKILLYGGLRLPFNLGASDTWTFLGGNWTNVTGTAGSAYPCLVGTLAGDAGDAESLLFGGVTANSGGHLSSWTWAYKGGVWTNLTSTLSASPPIWIYASSAPDPQAGGGALLSGGAIRYPSVPLTYVFSHGAWSNLTATAGHTDSYERGNMAYDALDHVDILSGGMNATYRYKPYTYALVAGTWVNWTSIVGELPPTSSQPVFSQDDQGGVVASNGFPMYAFSPPYTWSDTWELAGPLSVSSAHVAPRILDVGGSVTFNASTVGGFSPVAWSWNFGDGSTPAATNLTTHTYTTAGTFLATFSVVDALGGNASWSVFVVVNPTPSVTASASPSATDVGVPVTFKSVETGGTPTVGYAWTFGDGSTGTGSSTTHAFRSAGTFHARVWANDSVGASGTASTVVTVNALPKVTVSASSPSVPAGTSVTFSPSLTGGTGPDTYAWNFTDGNYAGSAFPTHAFATAGTYLVNLTVTDTVGAKAYATVSVDVTAVVAPLTVTAVATPGGGTTSTTFSFTATATGGSSPYTYSWNFGDGSAAGSGSTATYTYTKTGDFAVIVTATDSTGKTASFTVDVSVLASPSTGASSAGPGGFSTISLVLIVVLAVVAALFAVLWVTKKPKTPAPAGAAPTPPPAAPAGAPAQGGTLPPPPPPI